MPQEFLASFAVDIDEGGVNRLQRILEQNRELAEKLASAFDAARSSMESFIQSASQDLTELPFFRKTNPVEEAFGTSGTFSIDLNFDNAAKQLETFLAGAKKQLRLSADGSGIVSAVSSAISQARSMLAGAGLKLTIKTETENPNLAEGAGPVRYLATGGRFTSPTKAEIAEDGGTEYVIPASKENEAVPLVRSLLSELSVPARETLSDALAPPLPMMEQGDSVQEPEKRETVPETVQSKVFNVVREVIPDRVSQKQASSETSDLPNKDQLQPRLRDTFLVADLPELFSTAPAAALPQVTQNMTSNNVQAPVNIKVEAASANPEAIGKSIYNTAEQYLLRTLQGVNT